MGVIIWLQKGAEGMTMPYLPQYPLITRLSDTGYQQRPHQPSPAQPRNQRNQLNQLNLIQPKRTRFPHLFRARIISSELHICTCTYIHT